jgi:CubicO group peptidase (beta-lactamase class C family)
MDLAAPAALESDELVASIAPALEAKVGAFVREHRLPGVTAGVADTTGLRWSHAAGFADLDNGRRSDARALHRIASISKTVTASAILQLRDEGRLGLDDPAIRYVPELKRVTNPHGSIEALTIRRLLMHTSGLQGEAPWQDLRRFWMYRPEELVDALHLVRVVTPPETDHKYSNLGYELLGLIVERVAAVPYTDRVRSAVLDPLGMRDTTWFPDDEQMTRRAVGYDGRAYDDHPPRSFEMASDVALADGGLWSTVDDLGRWIAQQLRTDDAHERGEGQILRGPTLAEMHRPVVIARPDWSRAWGLGWYSTRKEERVLTGHSGSIWGYVSNVAFSPADKVGVVVLLNSNGDAPGLAWDLMDTLQPAVRDARNREPLPLPVRIPDRFRELVGAYRDPEGGVGDDIVVEWRDGRLVLPAQGAEPEHELVPTDDPLVFTLRGGRPGGEQLSFIRAADGRISRCNFAGYPAIRVDLMEPADFH